MPEVYAVNLIQINPLWRAVGVGFFAVGYVVVIDLPVQLAVGEVQLDWLVGLRLSIALEEGGCLVNDFIWHDSQPSFFLDFTDNWFLNRFAFLDATANQAVTIPLPSQKDLIILNYTPTRIFSSSTGTVYWLPKTSLQMMDLVMRLLLIYNNLSYLLPLH